MCPSVPVCCWEDLAGLLQELPEASLLQVQPLPLLWPWGLPPLELPLPLSVALPLPMQPWLPWEAALLQLAVVAWPSARPFSVEQPWEWGFWLAASSSM